MIGHQGRLQNPELYRCQSCGTAMDGFTAREPESYPSVGDLAVCGECHVLHTFVENGLELAPAGLEATLPEEVQDSLRMARGSLTMEARYAAETMAMVETICKWVREHPLACLQLNTVDVDHLPISAEKREALRALVNQLPPDKRTMGIFAGLNDCVDWWGANEDTRDLLRTLDRESGSRASFNQARMAFELVFGSEVDA